MSSAFSRLGQLAASLVVAIVGCSQDTRTDYVHVPTARIDKERTLARAELAPFTIDGVVAAPLVRALTPQRTQVWLKLWSDAPRTVSARGAQLSGSGAPNTLLPAEQSTLTEKNDIKGVLYGLVLLGEVSSDALTALGASGTATLAVDLRVAPATEYRRFSFELTRQKTQQWATH